jgi:hypothetical protein
MIYRFHFCLSLPEAEKQSETSKMNMETEITEDKYRTGHEKNMLRKRTNTMAV